MPTKTKLTDEEREHRRAEDRERLKQAAEQLLTSEGWRRWVRDTAPPQSVGFPHKDPEKDKCLRRGKSPRW